MAEHAPLVLVLDSLDRLAVELVAITNAAISEIGDGALSLPQWRLLIVLGGEETPLRLNEVARRISASMPSASRLVDRMERYGFVSSSRDSVDGRGRLCAITESGDDIRRRVIARRRAIIEEDVTDVAAERGLADALDVVVERLRAWL